MLASAGTRKRAAQIVRTRLSLRRPCCNRVSFGGMRRSPRQHPLRLHPRPGALFEAIRQDPVVKVPSDFVLVGRVFSFLSGIAHTLGSRANVLAAMGAAPPR